MKCIGLDPAYAKPIGWAFRGDHCWYAGEVDPEPDCVWSLLTEVRVAHGINTAIIEDGYVGPNARVAMQLSMVRGQLLACATKAGLEVRLVAPATWQTALLSQGHWRPKTHSEIIRQTMWRVRNLHGLRLPEDQAVACCLAEWGDGQPEGDAA